MMNDKHIKNISAYVDGQCTPVEAKKIERHLQSCRECRKKFNKFLALKAEAKKLKTFPVSPYFARRVVALAEHRKKESFWSALEIIPRPLLNAAFILSIVIIVFAAIPWKDASTANDDLPNIVENSLVSGNDLPDQSLDTNDEALQFALNDFEEPGGETK